MKPTDPLKFKPIFDLWTEGNYPLMRSHLRQWVIDITRGNAHESGHETIASWTQMTPHQPLERLVLQINPELKASVTWFTRKLIQMNQSENNELKYLLYDWTKDPLLSDQSPEFKALVLREQKAALERLNTVFKLEPNAQVVRDFLVRSGIHQLLKSKFNEK